MSKIIAITKAQTATAAIQHFGHNNVKEVDLSNFPQCKLPTIAVKYIQRQIKEGVSYIVIPQDEVLLAALDEALVDYTKATEDTSLMKLIHQIEVPEIDLAGAIPSPAIYPELTGGMIVYVDDIRDPRRFLKPEQCKDVWWVKHWFAAKNFLFEHEAEIEVLHLDHYLGNEEGLLVEHIVDGELVDTSAHIENTRGHTRDHRHTGTDLFHMVVSYRQRGRMFANLKCIYLHSNAREITAKLMNEYQGELGQLGIALIHNPQEW